MKKVPPRPWGKILKVSDPGGGARPSPPWRFNGSLSLSSKHLAHTRLIAGVGPDPRLSSSSHRSTPSPASPRPPPSSRSDGAKSPRLWRLVPPVILHG